MCVCVCGCVSVISTVSLIVPSLKLCSTAIAFTAQLASDYLSHTHRNKNTEMHTAIFAYRFHLEIVILVIRQTERKHNYGTGFHSVTACVCVCVRDAMFLCQTCVVENVSVLYKQNIRADSSKTHVCPFPKVELLKKQNSSTQHRVAGDDTDEDKDKIKNISCLCVNSLKWK